MKTRRKGRANSGGVFDLPTLKTRLKDIEAEMADPGFWDRPERARSLGEEARSARDWVTAVGDLDRRLVSTDELIALADEGGEESLRGDMETELREIEKVLHDLETRLLLGEEIDGKNAILSIHAGAGGTDAQDWAEILLRMYRRWSEERRFTVRILDLLPGEEAGVKSVTLLVGGPFAYGYLKAERGVHRLVRLSPFDSAHRRHTSFASVDVVPEVDDAVEVEIDENDLRIDTYRSSGAGGQHVNVTDSAVRITHEPTGIVVQCQNERSQHKNRSTAMKILRARLYDRGRRLQEEEMARHHGDKKKIEWGSQIRSYVLHPYTLVKDHRTGHNTGSVEKVLDGDLDSFMEAYLTWAQRET